MLPEGDACLVPSEPWSPLFQHLCCFGISLLLAKINVSDSEIFCLPAQGRTKQNIFHMPKSKRENFFGGRIEQLEEEEGMVQGVGICQLPFPIKLASD